MQKGSPFFCLLPDCPVALDGEGDGDVDGAAEEGAAHRVEEGVADHVEELAPGEVVDARGVDLGGDSRDILNFGPKTRQKTRPDSGSHSALGHS